MVRVMSRGKYGKIPPKKTMKFIFPYSTTDSVFLYQPWKTLVFFYIKAKKKKNLLILETQYHVSLQLQKIS